MKQILLAVTDPFNKAADVITQANPNPGQTPNLLYSVGTVINWILGLLGIFSVIILIYAGILYMSSKGDHERVDRAKRIILNAFWGLIVIAIAYSLSYFIFNLVLGANGLLNSPGIQTDVLPPPEAPVV